MTTRDQITTVEKSVTVTTSPAATVPSEPSGAALNLLDRSEAIQGQRSEIDRLRQEAEDRC